MVPNVELGRGKGEGGRGDRASFRVRLREREEGSICGRGPALIAVVVGSCGRQRAQAGVPVLLGIAKRAPGYKRTGAR